MSDTFKNNMQIIEIPCYSLCNNKISAPLNTYGSFSNGVLDRVLVGLCLKISSTGINTTTWDTEKSKGPTRPVWLGFICGSLICKQSISAACSFSTCKPWSPCDFKLYTYSWSTDGWGTKGQGGCSNRFTSIIHLLHVRYFCTHFVYKLCKIILPAW